jgi:glycosyltransferase involved in cell wall biosynthesis
LRVLYFVERFWPLIGGLEVISARLVTALAARGHEMLLVTSREHDWMPAQEDYRGVSVHRLPFLRGIHDRNLDLVAESRRGMNELVRRFRPQLIHASFSGPGIWVLPNRDVAPLILAFHGPWETIDFSDRSGLCARLLARARWVTACSQHALDELLRTAPPGVAERASVLLNGLDPAFDGEPPEPPPGEPVLLCAGRLVTDKAIDVALEALAELAATDPAVHLVVAGDGPERPALEAQASSLGLAGRVTFTGWVSPEEMHELTARATIVLVPSRLEGFGLIAVEAALMARPAIVADTGGLPEAVADGVTGIVVPCEDAGALAAAIRRLLAAPAVARAMGKAGRRRALARFGAERHVEEWDALYRRVAANGTV